MKTVDFRRIFRIGEDGIYFDGGEILYKNLIEREGFFGEERKGDGEFEVVLYSLEDYRIVFPVSAFSQDELKIQSARAKMGSFTLFLNGRGVEVKTLVNS